MFMLMDFRNNFNISASLFIVDLAGAGCSPFVPIGGIVPKPACSFIKCSPSWMTPKCVPCSADFCNGSAGMGAGMMVVIMVAATALFNLVTGFGGL